MSKIATIGFFDGVHRGHRFLFAQLKKLAKEYNLEPLIYTFDRHPKELLTGKSPEMLTTSEERQQLLTLHAEVRVLSFAEVQCLTAEQFMRRLYEEEKVSVLLMGYDHRFGSDRINGFSEYEKVARNVGLRLERAQECLVDGLPVSSTRIRKLLLSGQIQQVNRLLGYDYSLIGKVVHGNGIGRKIGFPTANIQIQTEKVLPTCGVYAANVFLQDNDQKYMAIVNIGINPTVGNEHLSIETHIIHFQGDLYDQSIKIDLLQFLREEKRFASLMELQKQIEKDIQSL